MTPQALAAIALEAAESRTALGLLLEMVFAEMSIRLLEQRHLERRDRRILDELRAARGLECRLELRACHAGQDFGVLACIGDRLDVDIEHVQKQTRRRRVGA